MVKRVARLITFIWICTKFLVPKTNGLLLSYKSKKATLVIRGEQELAALAVLSW